MTLRERLLDGVIDGKIGKGIVVTCQEFNEYFKDENQNYIKVFLANSEVKSGAAHSPSYRHLTIRAENGQYRIHPNDIEERMKERGLI